MLKSKLLLIVVCKIVIVINVLLCLPAAAFFLPDSGQTQCFSNKGKIKISPCPPPGDPAAQDGSYAINLLSYTIIGDGTALDLNTNLMWQREDDGIMRTWIEADTHCSGINLGGYTDWRLPSKRELIGIVNYGQMYPAIDRSAFPSTKNTHYWTVSKMPCSDGDPWSVDFAAGYCNILSPSTRAFTRCVRGGPLSFASFRDNGDGTVSDLAAGLTWQKNEKTSVGWTDALSYCENLSSGGHADWRVPNIKDYESLTHGTEGPSVMSDYLNFNINFPSWSSTTYLPVSDYSYKWTMNHNGLFGICSIKDKNCNKYGVRCVRGKQTSPIDRQEIKISPLEIHLWHSNGKGLTEQEVIISNAGSGMLTIGSIAEPSPTFSITSDTCSGNTLTALMSCSVRITLNVNESGDFSDQIPIPSSDADQPVAVIHLKGAVTNSVYLSDTGQASCYNGSGTLIGCLPSGSPLAQDGSYTMNHLSFLPYPDGTVRDNNTSLFWQQQDDGVIRSWDEAAFYCENLELGGYTDWRLSTLKELTGIADYGRYNPAIDSFVFPSTKKSFYWSSSFSSTFKGDAWVVNFSDGTIGRSSKASPFYVRCVRGARFPSNALVDNADGTTTDLLTGLMWEQGDVTASNWESSLAYCENLSLGGYTDWRLPNVRELTSIIDIRYKPAINHGFFPQVACGDWTEYWTATSYLALLDSSESYIPDDAYVVDFFNGSSAGAFEHKFYNNYNVRCVRGGTAKLPAALTGAITDSANGVPIAGVQVTVTDSVGTYMTSADSNGLYTVSGLISGSFTAVFEKEGYSRQIAQGTLTDGQTATLDVSLNPIPPLTINITSPADSAVVYSSPIEVTGSVNNDASITVNGIQALVNNGTFSVSIHIQKGQNAVTAHAADQYGQTASHSITITLITQGSISGLVTDSQTLSPVQSASVSVTDSLNATHTALTGEDGRFTIGGIESGPFSGSIAKEGFNLYTFTGVMGSGEIRTIQASLTKIFSAATLGDFGNVTVMEITGNYDAKKPDGSLNVLPRQEIAREFLRLHPDEYDFLIVFTNFAYAMPEAEAKGFYLEVKNDTSGIGKSVFDNTSFFGSNGKLQGIIDMGNAVTLITDLQNPNFEDTVNTLIHEQMHRWGSYVRFRDRDGGISTRLLGKDASHWSFLLHSNASLHYGNAWLDNSDGTFTSTGGGRYCGPLDRYLMGFYDKLQVPPMLLIENPSIDPAGLPYPGITVSGMPRFVTIDDIIAAEGERVPDASSSQKVFRAGFILITTSGSFAGNELAGIENVRDAWAGKFSAVTGGLGSIADVAPRLTLAISSPVQGETLSGDITVKGSFVNSTGNDTGITVNGIPATVYGNQFVANNISLEEGENTITAVATDSEGRTASASVTVSAIQEAGYLRLHSNIEAGVAPFQLVLSMDASFSFEDAEFSISGPATPQLMDGSENEYRFLITAEGMYSFTARATDPDGHVYEDTLAIACMNASQMDNLLRRKWEGMKDSLRLLDFDKAVTFFTEETRSHYHDIFTGLDAHMPQIVQDMQDIEKIYIRGNSAKYRIRKDEFYSGQMTTITHYIYFAVDNDGVWRIDWY
jgi:hypothetical protein